jgi:hypothetical protein
VLGCEAGLLQPGDASAAGGRRPATGARSPLLWSAGRGGVAERSNAPVLKTGEGGKSSKGSNPFPAVYSSRFACNRASSVTCATTATQSANVHSRPPGAGEDGPRMAHRRRALKPPRSRSSRGCRAPARVVVITPNTLRAALALLLVMGGERWEPRLDAVMARTGGLLTGVRTARRGR